VPRLLLPLPAAQLLPAAHGQRWEGREPELASDDHAHAELLRHTRPTWVLTVVSARCNGSSASTRAARGRPIHGRSRHLDLRPGGSNRRCADAGTPELRELQRPPGARAEDRVPGPGEGVGAVGDPEAVELVLVNVVRLGPTAVAEARIGTAWTSGLSATLPRRGLRWPPSEQPPSSAQPPWAARRLHGGRAWLTLTVRAWLTLTVRAWLTLTVRAWLTLTGHARRRRRALHVLFTDVPIEFVARSKHQATGDALLGHRWLLSQHRGISPAAPPPPAAAPTCRSINSVLQATGSHSW
jgi:hypothetical protein